ncbi:MAG: aspartate-semialdehyde dehydrogenase, partial [Bradyrhizobium sp.]
MRAILDQRDFPLGELRLFASARSAGTVLRWRDRDITVEDAATADYAGLDIAFFSAGGSTSLKLAPVVAAAGAIVIDNSSAWRGDPEVPLVVSEVNPHAMRAIPKGIIANPNCATITVLVPLWPIHQANPVERLIVSTYQAASGGGAALMAELEESTRAYLDGRP